jgi:hypothetical protein
MGNPLNQFHHEIRLFFVRRSSIEHLGDVGVVHQGQCLPFGLKARHDLPGIHADLDDFERHFALDRLTLFGHKHRAHAAFADLLHELVRADLSADVLGAGRTGGGLRPVDSRRLQKTPRIGMGLQ